MNVFVRLACLGCLFVFFAGCPAEEPPEVDPTCSDQLANGDETDVDCGGPDCVACSLGRSCATSEDCAVGECSDEGQCDCPAGYEPDGIGGCQDVDECAAATDSCDASATCVNTDGGFTCDCPDGTLLSDGVCATCPSGSWGPDCANTCTSDACDGSVDCDPVSGELIGCTGCPDGTWGSTCEMSCEPGPCEGDVICDAITGELTTCLGACTPGTWGETCQEECEQSDCVACSDALPCGGDSECVSGFCKLADDEPCTDNIECAGTCTLGYCAPASPTGGFCDDAEDCTDPGEHDCSGNRCLLLDGRSCDTNDACLEACVNGACGPIAPNGGLCDEDTDCALGNVCDAGTCRLTEGEACDDNLVCLEACVDNSCTPYASMYGMCDEHADCESGFVCSGGQCVLPHGSTCADNTECETTCVRDVCMPLAQTLDVCEEDYDCLQLHLCDTDGLCRRLDSEACATNNDCLSTCIDGLCEPSSGLGGACDDTPDCQAGLSCIDGACLFDEGSACTVNEECAEVCIDLVCSPPSDTGEVCDETADCVSGHSCIDGTCLLDDGEECTANSECINVCIFGTCGPTSPLDGECDETQDCDQGHICTDDGECKRAEGAECSTAADCATPNTDCVDGACLTDTSPDSFSFTDRGCLPPGSEVTSNTVNLSGFYGPLDLSVDGDGDPQLLINGINPGANTTVVSAGDTLALQVTAPAGTQASGTATATLGTLSRMWTVATAPNISPGSEVYREDDILLGSERNDTGPNFTVPVTATYVVHTYMHCRDRQHNGEYHYTLCSASLQRRLSDGSWSGVVGHSHTNGACCTGQSYVLNRSTTTTLSASETYRFSYAARPRISGTTTTYDSYADVAFQACN